MPVTTLGIGTYISAFHTSQVTVVVPAIMLITAVPAIMLITDVPAIILITLSDKCTLH